MSASREKKKRQEERLNQTKNAKRTRSKASVDKLRRGIVIAVACVLILAVAALAVMGSGMPQKQLSALTIDGVNVSAAEYNFHYFGTYNNFYQTYSAYFSYFGWDTLDDFTKGEWSEGVTVADYLHEQTVESLKSTVSQSERAKSEGISISESNKKALETTFNSYLDAAASYGLSTNDFLAQNYGYGVDENVLRSALERIYLASAWQETTSKGYTNEQLESAYNADRTTYDWVSYRSFTISGAYSGDLEGDEKTQAEDDAKAEAKAKADEMLSRVTTSEAFKALSKEYEPEPEEDEDANDDGTDTTLNEKAYASSNSTLADFLYDEARVKGDKTVIESGTNYIVLLFLDRGRDEDKLVSVRHILIYSAEDYTNATDEEKAAARGRCGELLEQWKADGATEDAFAALATQYTDDSGSSYNGGLYEDISNSGWEAGFAGWCFDTARKPGDTGVIDTSYGSHAMYFVGYGDAAWTADVRNDLLAAESSDILSKVEVTEHKFAMSLSRTVKS